MITASELAGFFAAHAIWCLSDEDGLTPMVAHQRGNQRDMTRLVHDQVADAVEAGKQRLNANPDNAEDAALVYDGFVTIEGIKLDAVIVELRAYVSPSSQATLAIPYTPKSTGAFRVHRPKLLQWDDCEDFDMNAVLGAFFDGVAKHEKGSAVWSATLDESR
ncbi:MAG TPA: hypothetical protein VGO52_02080 [Hyphomonadaceae bacterium]|nr:hypothetical protein [Hyphomonadaceae bacterium]